MTETPRKRRAGTGGGAGKTRLGLNDRLGLIGLIDEGIRAGSPDSPGMSDLFNNLWDLVNRTVSGARIDRLNARDSGSGFQVLEINAETGETLGRLNMLYLRKPIPCYYLVYVEVAPPFRKKGLGNRILEYFREFLIQKSAVGILDNIIPGDDPTYHIYFKQAWEPLETVAGERIAGAAANYMVYVPPRMQRRPLREPILKLIHHLERKRTAIDMRDNELMVRRTIDEFRELHEALLAYFDTRTQPKESSLPLMRFMFTRFVTKLIAFRRRIATLIGYTGGESLEQIVLRPEIAALPVQSYAPSGFAEGSSFVSGDAALWRRLPETLRNQPARGIEALPNYRRPSTRAWLKERGLPDDYAFTIGDLMDLGFDPTRLKEITLDGETFIFERAQARQIPDILDRQRFLERLGPTTSGARARQAEVRINPPLLVIRDRGNAYVLRRKIPGIHWDEAVEQLESAAHLKSLNRTIGIESIIQATVREARKLVDGRNDPETAGPLDDLAFFVSWDLAANRPGLVVDFAVTYLEAVWLA